MSKRKICVVTGSRAEYGLLYWLIKEIESAQDLELQLIVTGMHLSPNFGLTYKLIEEDFKIDKKIDMNLFSDNSIAISKSMGIAQTSLVKAYNELKPDIVVVLGDRYEIFSATSAAMISNIPIAHIHGGEITEGSWDDCIRHCISKMAHLHFTATEEYRNRVIQLGEDPKRVFNTGGMGIESIKKLKLLSKNELEKSINFKLKKKNILITFHPVTLEKNTSKKQFQELLDTINDLNDTGIIFTKTNSDLNGKIINQMIDQFTKKHSKNSIGFTSLGQLRYLSVLQYVDVVVGNSSSGLLETPSFKIGAINIGDRQKGRIRGKNVIDCLPNKKSIQKSLAKLYSKNFQKLLKNVSNPYDNGPSSKKIIRILKDFKLKNILKKNFYNIKFKI
ncbi:UDP-N-acetylglucosamine 2-epimerase [Candidatus Pelagibacter sp.]|nr:UDP-N-acetylglucosamine 2-epimerase [Candidatus Pelagibacter sp.]